MPWEDESSSENKDIQPEPLERAIQFKQQEREKSSEEEDMSLAELQRRIRDKKIMDDQQYENESDHAMESGSNETLESEQCENSGQNYDIPLDTQKCTLRRIY